MLWGLLPAVVGLAAPLIFRSRPFLASAVAVIVPPILICLYYVRDVIGDAWGALGLTIISFGWFFCALLGAMFGLIFRTAFDGTDAPS